MSYRETASAFPFAEYWWLYAGFTALIVLLLAIDLSFDSRRPPSMRRALRSLGVWVGLALAFCVALYLFTAARHGEALARQVGLEFLTGYIVEESLSIDNMFVFALLFRYFAVPAQYQHRVLFYGVMGAILCRGAFIAIGTALIRFDWVVILFGVFLIVSGCKLAFSRDDERTAGENRVVRYFRRFLPVTDEFHGGRLFVRRNGAYYATPLFLVLLSLESTDIVFATDSVPAVLGVTRDPFVVYSSNIFAVLGLRAMFFLLAGALERFHALKHGLAIVLAFVGLKMVCLDRLFGGRMPIGLSLAIIALVIAASVVLSLVRPRRPRSGSPVLP
jgi:tellurite resistance protein TerC